MTRVSIGRVSVILLAVLFAWLDASAKPQEYRLTNGQSLEAELIGVYGGIVYLDLGNHSTSYVAYSWLDEESKAEPKRWFDDYVAKLDEPAPKVGELSDKLSAFLSKSLVRPEGGKFVRYDMASREQPEFYLFYTSASWCGPCRRFTPKLVAFYNLMKREGHDFELIFVSSDHSSKQMLKYMEEEEMPWPAVSYGKADNNLVRRYGGPGIPCLAVTDRNGTILMHTYAGEEYLGPSEPMERFGSLLLSLRSLRNTVEQSAPTEG